MYLFLVLALELYKIDAKNAESFQWTIYRRWQTDRQTDTQRHGTYLTLNTHTRARALGDRLYRHW